MDQWQGYQDAAGAQRRYNNGTAQMTPGRDFGQHQQAGLVHPPQQPPAGALRYDSYGNLTQSSTTTSPLSTPQLRDGNGDIPMQDVHDPYGSMKYPLRPHHQTQLSSGGRPAHINLHSPSEPSAAAQRYSPMEVLSPTSPYPPKSTGPGSVPPSQSQYGSARQSPTRGADYVTSPYYSRQPSTQQLPPISPYAGQQPPPPADGYPSSTVAQLDSSFAGDPKSPPRRPVPQQSAMLPEKRPVPEFKKIRAVTDLRPKVNAQPAFRRANPEGGFISVRHRLFFFLPSAVDPD